MKLISASGECQRCAAKWREKNAMALAAQHHGRTGHPVKVTMNYAEEARSTAKKHIEGTLFEGRT